MNMLSSLAAGLNVGIKHDPRSVAIAVVGLLTCLIVYLAYKLAWHRDFGMPVRRRLLCRSMFIERDRVAFVPVYWSDVQVQRAIRGHWKESLRKGFPQGIARSI